MTDEVAGGLTVRAANRDEADSVGALVASAGLPTVGLDQAWAVVVMADDAGELVGVAALERHGSPAVFLLRSVAVRPDRHGAGHGSALVNAALAAADADAGGPATVGLLTETADGYFDRFGFRPVERDQLPAALAASPELLGACADTARAYVRTGE
jgi:amino-acid N-acetyltransferase